MIVVKPSYLIDTRSARTVTDVCPSKQDLLDATERHIDDVRNAMAFFACRLLKAAMLHDHTKVDDIDGFYAAYQDAFNGISSFTGSPFNTAHLASERHHLLEHVPDDVNLIDVIERIADTVMANTGRGGGTGLFFDSMDADLLQKAYTNTVYLLQGEVVFDDSAEDA